MRRTLIDSLSQGRYTASIYPLGWSSSANINGHPLHPTHIVRCQGSRDKPQLRSELRAGDEATEVGDYQYMSVIFLVAQTKRLTEDVLQEEDLLCLAKCPLCG